MRYHFSKKAFLSILLLFALLAIWGCESKEMIPESVILMDSPDNAGVYNALRKAAQMRNIEWSPVIEGMPYNQGYYLANKMYKGLPYSAVLEYHQHVFLDVSLETFMTAVHNPRSVLYTENVSAENSKSSLGRTYYGTNCACYYGSTCSYLITYSLGFPYGILATEIPYFDEMEVVNDQSANGVKLADVLSSRFHVVLVTGIKRFSDGTVYSVTITENAGATTSTTEFTPDRFEEYLASGYTILRYKNIENNTEYTPFTDFVAVEGELLGYYLYNDYVCPNYGNKSNYIEGDDVIINITEQYEEKGFTHLMVFKDEVLLQKLSISGPDMVLRGLTFGDYKVCLSNGLEFTSDYSYFKVVNMNVKIDSSSGEEVVLFSSANATPVYYDFCGNGGRKGPVGVKAVLSHLLTSSEIESGRAILSPPLVPSKESPYIKVHFKTEYGRVFKSARKDII